MNTVELRESRAKLIADARKIIDTADTEKRDLRSDESEQVDRMFAESDKLQAKIDTQEKREAIEAEEARLRTSERKTRPTLSRMEEEPNRADALRSWFGRGHRGFSVSGGDIDNAARCGIDLSSGEIEFARPGLRAMSKGGSTTGSKLVEWTDFYSGFFEELKSYSQVLSLISYHNSDNGQNLPFPVMDDTSNEAAILDEASTATAADPTVSNVTLGAFKYESKEVILSLELLQDSSINLEEYVGRALAARFARAWAKHVTIGTGSGQPSGIVTRATNSSVVATGTTSVPTYTTDMLIDLAESLDDAYRFAPNVGYMMAPATMAKIRKLKDSNGQYLWQPSVQAGNPDMFNGHRVYRNQHMATSGASARTIVFGDFSKFVWRNVQGVQLYRLNEFRIRSGQISFIAFARGDGNLILPNAVKYLAAPAS